MSEKSSSLARSYFTPSLRLAAVAALALLAGCAATDPTSEFTDPYEASNRQVHRFNKSVDRSVLRPTSQTYGTVLPAPVRRGVSNFADNLALPGMVVNNLLQARPGEALQNSGRFLFNSTIGLGGVLDPADSIRLYEREADFGGTLHVWGVREGAYVELPLLGPSTERDVVGKIVDFALDPLGRALPAGERGVKTGASYVKLLGDRYEYADTIDSILYDSADSYAQARALYLQNRRYELGGDDAQPDYDRPDYSDPYEDPYAQ
ncbi:VacJ family lipoprotein [Rhodovulum iodosum]|nr:VacJ family lipoprotein [Rhodovulum robiginosum]RSK39429.1 VacJ family lipoprotein [Rhodovulum robiginosum]